MKRKVKIIFALLLIFCVLSGFSVSPAETVLADKLSESASVQLFTAYNDTFLFAYTDGETHILKTDGTASAVTAYPSAYVFLRGQHVITVSPMEDLTVAEYLNADSLTRTRLIGLEMTDRDILDLDTDGFGRVYAVYNNTPDILHIFDDTGSYAGNITCPTNILGIQVLGDRLYIFLPERCLYIVLEQSLPQSYTEGFTYSGTSVPFYMLNHAAYINTDGIVYSTTGRTLTTAAHYALYEQTLAANDHALFLAGIDNGVARLSFSGEPAAHFYLPGTAAALTATAAVVRTDDRYLLVPYGEFKVPATPTPAASTSPSVLPTPSAAPVHSPSPIASPTPAPGSIPGVTVKGEYIYVPAGTTAAALRKSLPYTEAEICSAAMSRESGKIRTGWIASIPGTQYTLIVPGDINSSGTINSVDIRLMQQFLLGMQIPQEIQILAGDLSADGVLDTTDLVLLAGLMQ